MPGTSGNDFNIVIGVDVILETKYSIKQVLILQVCMMKIFIQSNDFKCKYK